MEVEEPEIPLGGSLLRPKGVIVVSLTTHLCSQASKSLGDNCKTVKL